MKKNALHAMRMARTALVYCKESDGLPDNTVEELREAINVLDGFLRHSDGLPQKDSRATSEDGYAVFLKRLEMELDAVSLRPNYWISSLMPARLVDGAELVPTLTLSEEKFLSGFPLLSRRRYQIIKGAWDWLHDYGRVSKAEYFIFRTDDGINIQRII